MPIKPVDFQVMIPKSSEISKIQLDQQQKSTTAQQQITNAVRHKVDSEQKQVYRKEDPQKGTIREKNRDKRGEKAKDGQQHGKGNREGKEGKEGNRSNSTGIRSKDSIIDIRI